MSPLGLSRELEMRWPSGTRSALTMPPCRHGPERLRSTAALTLQGEQKRRAVRNWHGQEKYSPRRRRGGPVHLVCGRGKDAETAAGHLCCNISHLKAVAQVGLVAAISERDGKVGVHGAVMCSRQGPEMACRTAPARRYEMMQRSAASSAVRTQVSPKGLRSLPHGLGIAHALEGWRHIHAGHL